MSVEILRLAKEVPSLGQVSVCQDGIPALDDEVIISQFHASGAFSVNVAVLLYWAKPDGSDDPIFDGTEELLWTDKGHGQFPGKIVKTGNNTHKVFIVLDNGETGAVYISGYAVVEVKGG